jgi:hypothetical protein
MWCSTSSTVAPGAHGCVADQPRQRFDLFVIETGCDSSSNSFGRVASARDLDAACRTEARAPADAISARYRWSISSERGWRFAFSRWLRQANALLESRGSGTGGDQHVVERS